MQLADAMKKLEALGTEQNRKVYRRHGARDPLFGVSFAHLGKLKKEIGVDQGLAEALWASGNHDAQVLATMVANPDQLSAADLDRWATKAAASYVLADLFAKLVVQTRYARPRMEKWTRSKQEFLCRAGWHVLAGLALGHPDLPDVLFEQYLKTIEEQIHAAANYARHGMNMALISIGMRNARLEKQAIAAARRIGKVLVDHGDTSCQTPDAEAYILRAKQRKRR